MFKSNRNKIVRGRHKSKAQECTLQIIKMVYEGREAVIKLINDSSIIASEAKYKTINGEGIKILTPKQMLQRVSIKIDSLFNWT